MASQPSRPSRHSHTCSVHASTHALSPSLSPCSSRQELYIAFNNVSDVSLVAMLPHLQVLDIERCLLLG